MTLFLIDASHYQAGLPIPSLTGQGFVGVILKATQNTAFKDPRFPGWLAQARTAGLLTAAYHFLHEGNLVQQAALTRAVVPPDIPVWVDVERFTYPDGTVSNPTRDDAYAFADALRARGGRVAGIYYGAQPRPGYGGWWRAGYLSDPTGSAQVAYLAQGGDTGSPWSAGQTRHPDIWQFCQHGRVAGYSGDVDLNAYRGTLQQLASSGWFWVPPNLDGSADMPLSTDDLNKIKALVPQAGYLERMVDLHVAAAIRNVAGPQLQALGAMVAAIKPADVDEADLAAHLAPLLGPYLADAVPHVTDADLSAIAKACADETARRQAS